MIPWFIEKSISELAAEVRGAFSVLVIAPTTTQCRRLTKGLRGKGFTNVSGIEPAQEGKPLLIDGLKLLIDDGKSNLGWRIICKELLDQETFKSLIEKTSGDSPKNFDAIVSKELKAKVKALVSTARKVVKSEEVDRQNFATLLEELEIDPQTAALEQLRGRLEGSDEATAEAAIRAIPIKVTTVQRSKGLAADFVFITFFDDQYFIRNADKSVVTDHDVCGFLVALTRARRKSFLISSKMATPTFLDWMKEGRCKAD